MNGSQGNKSSERWKLVMAARQSSTPPSDLELLLRQQCSRLKVVKHLNGAHIVIPMTYPKPDGGTISKTLAIRFYSSSDLQRLQDVQNVNGAPLAKELEGLKSFASSFATSLVFFECPSDDSTLAALGSQNSFPRQAMNQLTTNLHSKGKTDCITNFVKRSQAALEIIFTFSIFMEPGKAQSREAYFRKQEVIHCVPPQPNSQEQSTETPQQQQRRLHAQSYRVCEAMRKWARDFDLPVGEEDVLMKMSQNLQSIATKGNLQHIPLDESTRFKLQAFFETGEVDPDDPRLNNQYDQGPREAMDSQQSLFDVVRGGIGGGESVAPIFPGPAQQQSQSAFADDVPMQWDTFAGPENALDQDPMGMQTDQDPMRMDLDNLSFGGNHYFHEDQRQPQSFMPQSNSHPIAPLRNSFPRQMQNPTGVPQHQPFQRLAVSQRYGRSNNNGMSRYSMEGMHTNQSSQIMGQPRHYHDQQSASFGPPMTNLPTRHQYPDNHFITPSNQQGQFHPAPMRGPPPQPWSQTPTFANSRGGMQRGTVARPNRSMPHSQYGSQFRQWM